jgi:type VI protein secretion system component VasF
MKPILDQALVNHMANRKRPWLKDEVPWWAVAVFGVLLAVVAALFVWSFFYEGGIP